MRKRCLIPIAGLLFERAYVEFCTREIFSDSLSLPPPSPSLAQLHTCYKLGIEIVCKLDDYSADTVTDIAYIIAAGALTRVPAVSSILLSYMIFAQIFLLPPSAPRFFN